MDLSPHLDTLDRTRPLLLVDADEVLVHFATHFGRFVRSHGWDMRLTRYSLDDAFHRIDGGGTASRDEALALIDAFFETETVHQTAIPGAAETLSGFAGGAQILVLTNVPAHGGEARRANLAALGMPYPVIVNAGGKGPAIARLAERMSAPVVFLDDSPEQIASAAEHAPGVHRIHLVGCPMMSGIVPRAATADHRFDTWDHARGTIAGLIAR